ncbi:MAG: hypothetical protein J5696_05830 [Lachnospiraceae bacterium]|nr:hypothetical protein [Lachnospiraceae bacterium]
MRNYEKKLNTLSIFIIVFLGLMAIIFLPFLIEIMLFNETIFPFSLPIRLERSAWFSFIGSYMGAIGALFIGIVALLQSKKYNEASKKTDETFIQLHSNIRELNETNNKLNETNNELTKTLVELQNAIFTPDLSVGDVYADLSFEDVERILTPEHQLDHAVAFCNYDGEYGKKPLEIINRSYKFIAYTLFNDKEKTIASFQIKKIYVDGNEPFEKINCNYSDIFPHEKFYVFLALKPEKYDLFNSVISEKKSITVVSELQDSIGRKYTMKCDILYDETCIPPQLNVLNIVIYMDLDNKSQGNIK